MGDANDLDVKADAVASSTTAGEMVDSPSTAASESGEKTMTEAMSDVLKEHGIKSTDSSETPAEKKAPLGEEAEESDVSKGNKTKEKAPAENEGEGEGDEKPEGEKEENPAGEEATEEEAESQKPVPYERFVEVNTKLRDASAELEAMRPAYQEQQRFAKALVDNGIGQEDFTMALEVLSIAKRDPEAALKRLMPFVDGLRGLTGEVLPADLKAKVEANEVSLEAAKQWAKDRAKAGLTERQSKTLQERQQAERVRTHNASCFQAIDELEQTIRKTDPDYKPKASKDAPDGVWEKVVKMINRVAPEELLKSPKNATEVVKEIYDIVKSSHVPVRPVRRALSSNGSSTTRTTNKVPETVEEAVSTLLKSRGITMAR